MDPTAASDAEPRDRYMDALRVGALGIVVLGHWLLIVPWLEDGVLRGTMLYNASPGFWPLTWMFQVIPVFFFVAGFANLGSWRRVEPPHRATRFLLRRLRRLLIPTAAFMAAWAVIELIMNVLDLGGGGLVRGMELGYMTPFAPLWYLGVYLALVLIAPLTIRLHERFGLLVPAMLIVAVGAVDASAQLLDRPSIEIVNLLLVYALPFQLGYSYADGRAHHWSGLRWASAAVALLLVLAVLTALPAYGRNLYDNGNLILGTAAPTLPFAIAGMMVIAAIMSVRRPLAAWLEERRPWQAVSRLNGLVMTIFLWHMTAYFAAAALLFQLGLSLDGTPNTTWWLARPLFVAVPAVLLTPLLWIFSGIEKRTLGSGTRHGRRPSAADVNRQRIYS